MVSSDTVVGIVGAVILTGAMIAVFYYESNNPDAGGEDFIGEGDNTYAFQYQTAHVVVEDDTPGESLAPNGAKLWEFDLPAYVFDVESCITWQETGATGGLPSGNDEFRIELINTTGDVVDTKEGRAGPLCAGHGHGTTGDDHTQPEQMNVTVRADSEDEARETLANATADTHGVGTWQVRVTLLNTGDQPGAAQTDTGNDYQITIEYDHWRPVLQTDS